MGMDAVNTPAEDFAHFCNGLTSFRMCEGEEAFLDYKNGIDMVAGDPFSQWDGDSYGIQVKSIATADTVSGHIGVRFEADDYSQVGRVALDCEYQKIINCMRAGLPYPKAFVFVQWRKTQPSKDPAWFFLVKTEDLVDGVRLMVDGLLGDTDSQLSLTHWKVYRREGNSEGWFDYQDGKLCFDLAALQRLSVPYYLHPKKANPNPEVRQWSLI